MKRHTGSCLCGGVRFTIEGELAPIQVCHCMQCRKAQGTAMATNVPVAQDAFRLDEGDALLASFESSPGKQRVFCKRCGSPVLSRRDSLPGVVRVRLGLLDVPVDAAVQAHYFAGSKADWWTVCDGAPQFAEGRTRHDSTEQRQHRAPGPAKCWPEPAAGPLQTPVA